jgi:hypothetical protein
MDNVYLKDLVAAKLAERSLPGSVHIRPNKPLTARLGLGERATFIVEYNGVGAARLQVPEHEISCGTVGGSVEAALADMIERARSRDREVCNL